jgi:hypothetical protein
MKFQGPSPLDDQQVGEKADNRWGRRKGGPYLCPNFSEFLALFRVAAQRLNCACRILSRASGLIVRRFGVFGADIDVVLAVRLGPRFAGVAVVISSVLAFCSWAI